MSLIVYLTGSFSWWLAGQENAANVSLEVLKALPPLREREQPRGRFGSGGGFSGGSRFSGGRGGRGGGGGGFSGRRNDRFGSSGGRGRGNTGKRW